MKSVRDRFYSYGFGAVAIILTAALFFSNAYTVYPTNIPSKTIFGHMLFDDPSIFLTESSSYSAPRVCSTTHVWAVIFLPLVSSVPFLLTFASEMKGNYRLKLSRIGSFNKYWNKVFFKSGILGAGCVTAGYALFSAAVFSYFPHMSEYPLEPADTNDALSIMSVQRPLEGILNRFFGNTESEFLYWLPTAINIFAFSFLVAIMCLMLYLVMMNRYKAIGMPIIVFYLAEQLSDRRFYDTLNSKWLIVSPHSLFVNAENTFSSIKIGGFLYLIVFAVAAALLYLGGRALFKKRVMN